MVPLKIEEKTIEGRILYVRHQIKFPGIRNRTDSDSGDRVRLRLSEKECGRVRLVIGVVSATLGPFSEQTKGKLPVRGRLSLRASVSTRGIIVRYIPATLLLYVILMQMLVHLGSMTHALDQIPLSFLPSVYRVYSDLIAAPPSVCHPLSPVATGSPPPLSGRGGSGEQRRAGPGLERRQFSPNFLSLGSHPVL